MAVQHFTPSKLNLRIALLLTMVTLQLGDYLSTIHALGNGAVEIGAIGALASNHVALLIFKVACVIWFAAILYREKYPIAARLRWCALLCAFYCCVMVSNLAI